MTAVGNPVEPVDSGYLLREYGKLRAEVKKLRRENRELRRSRDRWREEALNWKLGATRRIGPRSGTTHRTRPGE